MFKLYKGKKVINIIIQNNRDLYVNEGIVYRYSDEFNIQVKLVLVL